MNEPKTHAIVTYTGVHYLITAEQAQKYGQKRLDDEVIVDGCILKMKNVADILTIEKYYEAHPNKRPPQTNIFQPLLAEPRVDPISTGKGLREMIIGLKKFIAGPKYMGTQAPVELLAKWENKLAEIK